MRHVVFYDPSLFVKDEDAEEAPITLDEFKKFLSKGRVATATALLLRDINQFSGDPERVGNALPDAVLIVGDDGHPKAVEVRETFEALEVRVESIGSLPTHEQIDATIKTFEKGAGKNFFSGDLNSDEDLEVVEERGHTENQEGDAGVGSDGVKKDDAMHRRDDNYDEADELAALKAEATALGLSFSKHIGVDTLRQRVETARAEKNAADTDKVDAEVNAELRGADKPSEKSSGE